MTDELERASRDLQFRIAYEAKQRQKAMKEQNDRFQRHLKDRERRRAEERAEQQRRERERAEQQRRELERAERGGVEAQQNTSSDEKSKVICTELNRRGLMSRRDYLLGLRYVRENLTPRHERGYHAWAVPAVRRMHRSERATMMWSMLANARADHIAFIYGDRSRRNRAGALLCALFAAGCWMIGGFVGEKDWRSLYRDGGPKEYPSI